MFKYNGKITHLDGLGMSSTTRLVSNELLITLIEAILIGSLLMGTIFLLNSMYIAEGNSCALFLSNISLINCALMLHH